MKDLSAWTPRGNPVRAPIEGQWVRLEPLSIEAHGDGLFLVSTAPDAAERFRFLREQPITNRDHWLLWATSSRDPLFFAVIDKATGKVVGRQSFARVDAANGVAEFGNVFWGPLMAGTQLATEAFFLFGCHLFDQLGYRRLEWRCHASNEHSRRAAIRFGFSFEGTFRNFTVTKGLNVDLAWFALVDDEWPGVREKMEEWLRADNFDIQGQQLTRLKRKC